MTDIDVTAAADKVASLLHDAIWDMSPNDEADAMVALSEYEEAKALAFQATAQQDAEIAELRDFMLEAHTGLVVLQNLLVGVGLDAGVKRAGEMLDRIDALAREGEG